jgi:hypothetical protein
VINIKNGDMPVNGDDFIIKKGLTKDEFEKSNLYKGVVSKETHSFTNYYLKPQLIGNERFILVLFFNPNDILDFVNISLSHDGKIPSWDNWSEKEEYRKKDEHDKWLANNISKPPYKYLWGEISSNYDSRSCSSTITIRYYN